MSNPGNVFLIGPMGAGKSTIGKRLAQVLGMDFLDSDQVIEERTGVDIPLVFEIEGEAGFRVRERAVIEELTARRGIVLATGGGAILDPRNRRALAARGFVVYLRATPEQSLARTGKDRNRPLLQTADPLKRLRELFVVRDPLYAETADRILESDGAPVQEIARSLAQRLRGE